MGEEFIILVLGTCGVIWFLLPLVLLLILWSRTSRLERGQNRLEAELLRIRTQLRTGETIPAPVAEQRRRPVEPAKPPEPRVAPGEIEAVSPPPRPRPKPVAPAPVAEEPPAPERETGVSLEEILAGKWLTWVGAIAVVIAAILAFKYAIDNRWIGPKGRVAIGIIAGMVVFAGGAIAMLKEYRWLSQGLVGAAAGILYGSIYAAFDWYSLWSQEVAFVALVFATAAVLAFSTIYRAQPTAILGLLGGFLVPFMLSTGHDRQWELFTYIFVLDLGVLGIASFRKWQPLQLTAFFGTLLIWLAWFANHYTRDKLDSTVILMTAYFLLFALLGVWHNTLRRLPARPSDFFLMLATPIVYFAALYGVTKADFSAWQGLMAVGLAGTYLGLAVFQLERNPAGKMVIVCLAGIAASFLTIAIPLQLTGHWIAIAWAAEALLLVELGLRFGQEKLRWAGFGLLIVVQLILVFYSGETFAHPDSFQTRFRTDPVVQDVLPPGVIGHVVGTGRLGEVEPSWTDIFNGRSLSFLASAIVLVVLAWEYRRGGGRLETESTGAKWAPDVSIEQAAGTLLALAPLTLLGMLIVETFAIGHRFDWIGPTVLGLFIVWSSLAAVGLVVLSRQIGPEWLSRVGVGVFALTALFLLVSLFGTLSGWRGEWRSLTANGAEPGIWAWFLINPRAIGYLFAMGAAAAAALLLRGGEEETGDSMGPMTTSGMLGLFAHLTGLALLTTEVYAQGVIRDWETATSLAVTGTWTLYAIATLIGGIYYRSAVVRILALLLFILTAGKVFAYDVWYLDEKIRYVAFAGLGVSLLLVSFLYRRYRDRIRAWMTTSAVLLAVGLGFLADAPAVRADDAPLDPLYTLRYRWPLELPAEESRLLRIAVPPDLYDLARNDLGDLRVIGVHDETGVPRDIPFVLNRPTDRRETQRQSIPLLNRSLLDGDTQFLLDLRGHTQPVEEISIEIDRSEHNYERTVRVYGADRRDAADWALLTEEGYLLDRTRGSDRLRVDHVEFPRSRFAFYKVVIENAGRPPLTIESASVVNRTDFRVPRHEYPAQILSTREDDKEHQTIVVLDVGYDNLPTAGLRLDVQFDGDYDRTARLEVSDTLEAEEGERVPWRPVVSFSLFRILREDKPPMINDQPDYSETRGRYLRLTIENGDDDPLRISAVTALGIDRWLVCEGRNMVRDDVDFGLYAGDALLPAPQYDLARTIGAYDLFSLPQVATGERIVNPWFKGPTRPRVPWSEEHAPLLWALTIGGVLLFGGLTVYLLYKTGRGESPNPGDEG